MEIAAANGAAFQLERGRDHRQARREIRADVLRSRLRADGDVQDARRGPGHPRSRAPTTSTTASRWPTSRASSEQHQLNSRLVKRDGKLVEEVYKVGGLYDRELTQHRRRTCATPCRLRRSRLRKALEALITFYETGARQRSRGVRHRLGAESRFRRRHDERLHRGLHGRARHEGRVGRPRLLRQPREDREDSRAGRRTRSGSRITCRWIRSIASRRCRACRRRPSRWCVEAGDSGPITPIGVNLPNDQRIREKYGSKSVSLSNVLDAYERALPDSYPPGVCLGRWRRWSGPSGGARLRAS